MIRTLTRIGQLPSPQTCLNMSARTMKTIVAQNALKRISRTKSRMRTSIETVGLQMVEVSILMFSSNTFIHAHCPRGAASQEYKYQVQEESKTLTEELGNFMASDNTVTDEKLLRRIHSDDTPFTLEKLEYAAYAAFQRVLERSACTLDILVLCWWPEYLRPFFTFPILPKLRSFAMCKNSAYGHNGEFIWTSSDLLVKHTPALQLFSIFMHRDGSSEEKGKKSFKFVSWRPTDRTRHKPVSELNPDIWHPRYVPECP